MRNFRLLLTLAVITMMTGAFVPAPARAMTLSFLKSATQLNYAVTGPYSVGLTLFQFDKGTSKSLSMVTWYPAAKQPGDQTSAPLIIPDQYQMPSKVTDLVKTLGKVTKLAAPDMSGAPYPFVIFCRSSDMLRISTLKNISPPTDL